MNNIEENLDLFEEVLDKCEKGDCVVTLKQFIERGDGLNQLDLQQKVLTEVRSTVYINGNYVYLTLKTSEELKAIKMMYETMLRRGTQKAKEGESNDYGLVIDIIHQEDDLIYTLSFIQPLFMSLEEDLAMVFTPQNMMFGKETLDIEEIEYEEALERERLRDIAPEETFSENEGLISNEDIIGSD